MEQPENVNTPVASLPTHPLRLAPLVPVPVVMARVTAVASAVEALPKTSSAVTTGCVPKALPPFAVLLGCVVKTRCVAGPPVTVSVCVSLVSTPETVIVGVPELGVAVIEVRR